MDLLTIFNTINVLIGIPFAFLFLIVGIILTIKTGFPQIFAFRYFLKFIQEGLKRTHTGNLKTIDAFHALFTAMAASIGIGTIVGPSLAIVVGGPGALFWLIIYAFFGSVTKLTEVVFALHYRKKTADGRILGGPAEYLKMIHPFFAHWYGFATLFLFAGWSGIQSNALSEILFKKGIPEWTTGLILACFTFYILIGGAQRVGTVASKLVPFMFGLYVTFCLWILLHDFTSLMQAIKLIFSSILSPAAPIGGFLGSSVFAALKEGVYKGAFTTESGMGTSSIAHAMSDVKKPIDQGILAMYSMSADAFLCLLSGLLVLTTGVWKLGTFSNTLVFNVFEEQLPTIGPLFFIISVTLFITTTVLGNAFNGGQSFATFTNYRWIRTYYVFVGCVIFLSSITEVPLVWAIMDTVLPFVALPNLIGVLILAFKHADMLRYK